MASRENPVVTSCSRLLELRGMPWMRNNSRTVQMPGRGGRPRPVFFGKPGWPDLIAVAPDGRFIGIECKAPELRLLGRRKLAAGKLSDLQKAVHRQLLASNAIMLTVHSAVELDDDLRSLGM